MIRKAIMRGVTTHYDATDDGRLFNGDKELTGTITKLGYRRFVTRAVTGSIVGMSYHRIVYETFVGPIPDGLVVDHIDGNKLNNNVSNLQLLTISENVRKAAAGGYHNHGDKCHQSYKIDHLVDSIRERKLAGESYSSIAKSLGVPRGVISNAANGTFRKRSGASEPIPKENPHAKKFDTNKLRELIDSGVKPYTATRMLGIPDGSAARNIRRAMHP